MPGFLSLAMCFATFFTALVGNIFTPTLKLGLALIQKIALPNGALKLWNTYYLGNS